MQWYLPSDVMDIKEEEVSESTKQDAAYSNILQRLTITCTDWEVDTVLMIAGPLSLSLLTITLKGRQDCSLATEEESQVNSLAQGHTAGRWWSWAVPECILHLSQNHCLGLLGPQMGPECWVTVTRCLILWLACGWLPVSLQRRVKASLTQMLGWSSISSQWLPSFPKRPLRSAASKGTLLGDNLIPIFRARTSGSPLHPVSFFSKQNLPGVLSMGHGIQLSKCVHGSMRLPPASCIQSWSTPCLISTLTKYNLLKLHPL